MAAIKWIHVATLLALGSSIYGVYIVEVGPRSGSISITGALHGASRLRNSTPLSKTHHSNGHLWSLSLLAAFCFEQGVDSPLFGFRL